jgi:hypothetical protein
MGSVWEVASAALFLASDSSTYITGVWPHARPHDELTLFDAWMRQP